MDVYYSLLHSRRKKSDAYDILMGMDIGSTRATIGLIPLLEFHFPLLSPSPIFLLYLSRLCLCATLNVY